jgi:hypothetical protein
MLPNQALKLVPQAEIVEGRKDQQREDESKPTAECPIERLGADWATPDCLNRIGKQVASIEHRDWQEVDESEIN